MGHLRLPDAPRSIQKGSTLKTLLDREAIECLAHNITLVHPSFDGQSFCRTAIEGLEPLGILQRGQHLARVLRAHLPPCYEAAVGILVRSLTPPLPTTDDFGLGVLFYLPHDAFVATYGLDDTANNGRDPFEISMQAMYEITRRSSAEFSIRPFLIRWPERTLARLMKWTRDPDPHVRRLCSEGTRPRLPWAIRIPAFVKDPRPVLPLLEMLKDDADLYVRRSVANHIGDIAKDHSEVAFEICGNWLEERYSPDLAVNDEGGYWENRDRRKLPEKRVLLDQYIRHAAKVISSIELSEEERRNPDRIADRVEEALLENDDEGQLGQ